MVELADTLFLPLALCGTLLALITGVILMRSWREQRSERERRNRQLQAVYDARDRREQGE